MNRIHRRDPSAATGRNGMGHGRRGGHGKERAAGTQAFGGLPPVRVVRVVRVPTLRDGLQIFSQDTPVANVCSAEDRRVPSDLRDFPLRTSAPSAVNSGYLNRSSFYAESRSVLIHSQPANPRRLRPKGVSLDSPGQSETTKSCSAALGLRMRMSPALKGRYSAPQLCRPFRA